MGFTNEVVISKATEGSSVLDDVWDSGVKDLDSSSNAEIWIIKPVSLAYKAF